jgi:hypothetical protein
MTDIKVTPGAEELQFDEVTPASPLARGPLAVTCANCASSIETEYYDIGGHSMCGSCRTAIESAAETPRGIAPLARAGTFGLGAGIVGAMIYYAVIAIANLEIGIVAILIGYMVGYAVRNGAGGRGARRFQVLAVLLTYFSIALAYTPLAVKGAIQNDRQARESNRGPSPAASRNPPDPAPSGGALIVGLAIFLALIAALPVLVVVGSFPSGLISALIFIGMRQAWVMTGAPVLQVYGPYRVGESASVTG